MTTAYYNQTLVAGIYPCLLHHLNRSEHHSTIDCTLLETGERFTVWLWPYQIPLLVMAMQGQPREPGSVRGTQVDFELGLKTPKRGGDVFNNVVRIHRPAVLVPIKSDVPPPPPPPEPQDF